MDWIHIALLCLSFVLILSIVIIVLYFIPQIISFLLEPKSGSMKSESEKSPKTTQSEGLKPDKMKVKTNGSKVPDSKKPSRQKESLLPKLNLFSRKKKCNECGTELEYREEYHSHYCPKCHTYK